MSITFPGRRTACPSAAASAPQKVCQKANDLAREAVGCMGVFGTLVARSAQPPACVYHAGTQSPGTTGVYLNHTPHAITLGTTRKQHHEPSYHGRHNGRPHAGAWHHGRSRIATDSYNKNGLAPTLPQRPNGLAFSCRERAGTSFQKGTISRAKRSTATPGWAGPTITGVY
jgi:hypothetical protein